RRLLGELAQAQHLELRVLGGLDRGGGLGVVGLGAVLGIVGLGRGGVARDRVLPAAVQGEEGDPAADDEDHRDDATGGEGEQGPGALALRRLAETVRSLRRAGALRETGALRRLRAGVLAWALLPRRGLLPLPALARLSSVHRLLRALPVLPALTRLLVALG